MTSKKLSLFEIKRWVIDDFRKLIDLGTPAEEIALGMAVGVFLGWLPIVGIQMITVLVLAVPFKKINKPAAFLAVWISNPLTIMPIYLSIYWVGTFFYPGEHLRSITIVREKLRGVMAVSGPFDQFRACIGLGADVLVPMFIGGTIIGALSFVPTYMLTRRIVIAYRWKRRRHKRKKALGKTQQNRAH
ncbi:MAG: DUF2062 domain-containing protein [Planctomycetota bacterium]